jgi:hypothetical protein
MACFKTFVSALTHAQMAFNTPSLAAAEMASILRATTQRDRAES